MRGNLIDFLSNIPLTLALLFLTFALLQKIKKPALRSCYGRSMLCISPSPARGEVSNCANFDLCNKAWRHSRDLSRRSLGEDGKRESTISSGLYLLSVFVSYFALWATQDKKTTTDKTIRMIVIEFLHNSGVVMALLHKSFFKHFSP